MGLDQCLTLRNKYGDEICYYNLRNVYFLRKYMIDNTNLNFDDNLTLVEVENEQLHDLYNRCLNVSQNKNNAKTVLPTMFDFEYDIDYFLKVEKVKNAIGIIKTNNEIDYATYEEWY